MNEKTAGATATDHVPDDGRSTDLRDSPMMARLADDLERGTDIGHYGRLTFTMVARHFLDENTLVRLLANQPDQTEESARGLVAQVTARGYSPPKRDKILAWQQQQEYAIIPHPDDPDSGNVYRELRFPDNVYENIGEYYEEKVEAE